MLSAVVYVTYAFGYFVTSFVEHSFPTGSTTLSEQHSCSSMWVNRWVSQMKNIQLLTTGCGIQSGYFTEACWVPFAFPKKGLRAKPLKTLNSSAFVGHGWCWHTSNSNFKLFCIVLISSSRVILVLCCSVWQREPFQSDLAFLSSTLAKICSPFQKRPLMDSRYE